MTAQNTLYDALGGTDAIDAAVELFYIKVIKTTAYHVSS